MIYSAKIRHQITRQTRAPLGVTDNRCSSNISKVIHHHWNILYFNGNFKEVFKHVRKNINAVLACKHFQNQGHSFNKHAKFIVTDKLVNIKRDKAILRHRLIERKNVGFKYWKHYIHKC